MYIYQLPQALSNNDVHVGRTQTIYKILFTIVNVTFLNCSYVYGLCWASEASYGAGWWFRVIRNGRSPHCPLGLFIESRSASGQQQQMLLGLEALPSSP